MAGWIVTMGRSAVRRDQVVGVVTTMVWLPDFGIGNRLTMLEKLLDIQRDATGISATDDNLHLNIKFIPYL